MPASIEHKQRMLAHQQEQEYRLSFQRDLCPELPQCDLVQDGDKDWRFVCFKCHTGIAWASDGSLYTFDSHRPFPWEKTKKPASEDCVLIFGCPEPGICNELGSSCGDPDKTSMEPQSMTIQYRFTNLAALADYCDKEATALRASVSRISRKSQRSIINREQAHVWESVANLLRNTVLTEVT